MQGCGLRGQVAGHLVVGEPVDRVPEEDSASFQTAADFFDPFIVDAVHPGWALVEGDVGGFGVFPEGIRAEGFDAATRVLSGITPELEECCQDGAGGWSGDVALAAEEEDDRAEQEHDRREEE